MYNFSDALRQLDGLYESLQKRPLIEAVEADTLVAEFAKGLQGWSYKQWQAAGSPDKESIVSDTIKVLGLKPEQEVYDIFWEWAEGLTAADFGEEA